MPLRRRRRKRVVRKRRRMTGRGVYTRGSGAYGTRKRRKYTGKGVYTGRGGFLSSAWNSRKKWLSPWLNAGASIIKRAVPASAAYVNDIRNASRASGLGNYTIGNALMNKGGGVVSSGPFEVPTFKKQTDTGKVTVSHREFIGAVYAPGTAAATQGFAQQRFEINPGLLETFPWLSATAKNYSSYRMKQLLFSVKSLVNESVASDGRTGTISMGHQMDVREAPFESPQQMMQTHGTVSGKTTENYILGVECDSKKIVGAPQKFIRYQDIPKDGSGRDPNDYDHGVVTVATSNIPSSRAGQRIGEIWVTYTVTLFRPKVVVGSGLTIPADAYVFHRPQESICTSSLAVVEPSAGQHYGAVGAVDKAEFLAFGGGTLDHTGTSIIPPNPNSMLWPYYPTPAEFTSSPEVFRAIGSGIKTFVSGLDCLQMTKMLRAGTGTYGSAGFISAPELEYLGGPFFGCYNRSLNDLPISAFTASGVPAALTSLSYNGMGVPPLETSLASEYTKTLPAANNHPGTWPPGIGQAEGFWKSSDSDSACSGIAAYLGTAALAVTFPANFSGTVKIVYVGKSNFTGETFWNLKGGGADGDSVGTDGAYPTDAAGASQTRGSSIDVPDTNGRLQLMSSSTVPCYGVFKRTGSNIEAVADMPCMHTSSRVSEATAGEDASVDLACVTASWIATPAPKDGQDQALTYCVPQPNSTGDGATVVPGWEPVFGGQTDDDPPVNTATRYRGGVTGAKKKISGFYSLRVEAHVKVTPAYAGMDNTVYIAVRPDIIGRQGPVVDSSKATYRQWPISSLRSPGRGGDGIGAKFPLILSRTINQSPSYTTSEAFRPSVLTDASVDVTLHNSCLDHGTGRSFVNGTGVYLQASPLDATIPQNADAFLPLQVPPKEFHHYNIEHGIDQSRMAFGQTSVGDFPLTT